MLGDVVLGRPRSLWGLVVFRKVRPVIEEGRSDLRNHSASKSPGMSVRLAAEVARGGSENGVMTSQGCGRDRP